MYKRVELVQKLLNEKRKTSYVATQYLEQPREYLPGEILYMREAHFIVAVTPYGNPTMSELAEKLDVTHGAVTQTAIRLEKRGFILRTKSKLDKRITTVSLTEKGVALYLKHLETDEKAYGRVSDALEKYTDAEIEELMEYERIVRAVLTKAINSN